MKSGYTVGLMNGATAADGRHDCNGTSATSGFYVTAIPVRSAGPVSALPATAAGTIYFDPAGTALAETGGTPIQ